MTGSFVVPTYMFGGKMWACLYLLLKNVCIYDGSYVVIHSTMYVSLTVYICQDCKYCRVNVDTGRETLLFHIREMDRYYFCPLVHSYQTLFGGEVDVLPWPLYCWGGGGNVIWMNSL